MKKTILTALAVASLTAGVILAGCGGADQSQTQTKSAATENRTADQAKPQADAYPIDWCIVSGEKFGGMGKPYVYNYKGRTVKFCCDGCVKAFNKSPDAFIARLDSAAAGLISRPSEHSETNKGGEPAGQG